MMIISVAYGVLSGIETPKKFIPRELVHQTMNLWKKLDLSGIEFPLTIKQIPIIEKRNNININVFGYAEKLVYPIYISKAEHPDHMELLYIEGQYEDEERQHYAYIKDFNRFMFNFTKQQRKKNSVWIVFNAFIQKESLVQHRTNCIVINGA